MENRNSSAGGDILGLLGVVFVTLKLTGVIDWSWWWVTAPFWGGIALVAVIFVVLLVIAFATEPRPKRRRRK